MAASTRSGARKASEIVEPIGQNTKQEMARQVRGRPPPKHVVQTGVKRSNLEIAQARDLDVECTSIQQRRADLHTRHFGQAGRRFDCRPLGLALSAPSTR
jgi:hypothetical protein